MAEFSTDNVRCAQCDSRLEVLDTASGGHTITVTGLGAAIEETALARERFFPPGAGADLYCPACDALIDPTTPYRPSQSQSSRRGMRRTDHGQ